MTRHLLLLLLLSATSITFAQNITIKGKLVDKEMKKPLEAATVYLQSAKDSTMIDYTISDRTGSFLMTVRKTDKPVILKTSMITFADYTRRFEGLSDNVDVGTIEIEDAPRALEEVQIKSEAPPVRIKNDTLEFNASSFKVRPDANVETLLKQLPGVEIDNDGKITVNGKEVNQILVNGKPFFDKDGKIALQNLPSDIINKVQITDTKTKKEETTGQAASSNNASINLTIDEDKNKGFFGKAMGGYGSDKRYESSLMLNYFKGNRKISVIGSSNNINTTGFSMNEIFDSMGGGRNYSIWTNDDGSFGINGMMFGGGFGIKKSNILGVNYSDEPVKNLTTNGSYFYTDSDRNNTNRTRAVTFLEDDSFTTQSNSVNHEFTFAHNGSLEIEIKPDTLTTISFTPKISRGRSHYESASSSSTTNATGRLTQENIGNDDTETRTGNLGGSLYIGRSSRKRKGRYLSSWTELDNNETESGTYTVSQNRFYFDDDGDGVSDRTRSDDRNQLRSGRGINQRFHSEFEWSEPVPDSMSVRIKFEYDRSQRVDDNVTYDFNGTSGRFDIFNGLLSNYLQSRIETFVPKVGLGIQKGKWNVNVYGGPLIANYAANGEYLGDRKAIRKNEIFPSANVWSGYNFTKTTNLWMNYNYSVDYPSAQQILDISDLSDPQNTVVGNPDLSPNKQHYFYLSLRDYNYQTKSGWSIWSGGSIFDSRVASVVTYDASLKSTTSYRNVSGGASTWFGGNWSRSLKKEAHSYRYGLRLSAGYDYDLGYITNPPSAGEPIPTPVLYSARALSLTPKLTFSYDYGELLSIAPNYSFTYSDTGYDNYVVDRQTNVRHTLSLQTTSYWPKNVVFGNDVSYTYNSMIADGFRKDFLLWNVSLGYNFLNKDLLAKVKVYDLLDQNVSATRTITPTGIRDAENTVLRRYVMFSLTYKLEKFGGKKKEENRFWWTE